MAKAAELETPTDTPQAEAVAKKPAPNRGARYRLFDDGEGDWCVYQIAPQGGELPHGTLVPIPSAPRFSSAKDATAWIRKNGAELNGMQVMTFKAFDISLVEVETRPAIKLTSKPKTKLN